MSVSHLPTKLVHANHEVTALLTFDDLAAACLGSGFPIEAEHQLELDAADKLGGKVLLTMLERDEHDDDGD